MQSFQFHPAVATWFERTFGTPTAPQELGWPAIQSGAHTLIAAPTGSGKTLAAFLASLDQLFCDGLAGTLKDEIRVLYVSPLKALSYRRLTSPRARSLLATVRTLIIDEIHALVGNRRGSHLALSMERLASLTTLP